MRGWGGRALLALVSCVTALALAELGVRLLWKDAPPALFTVTEREFQRLPGIFQPGQRVEMQPGTAFAHTVTIDSLGFRGADLPRAKPPGEFRVLFAGDSFTWGHNVEDDETLPAQLEARLRERCGSVRVINAGLSGSTILAQQAMIARGLELEPDLVILMFHENDIDELIHTRTWEALAENRRVKSRFPVSWIYPLVRRSRLWSLGQHLRRVSQARGGDVVIQGARTPGRDSEEAVEAARSEYARRLGALAGTLSERGVPLLFAAFPHPNSVTDGEGGPHFRWVLETAAAEGIPTVDLLATLLESEIGVDDAFLVPEDYHPSPVGHGIAADRVAEASVRVHTRCREEVRR